MDRIAFGRITLRLFDLISSKNWAEAEKIIDVELVGDPAKQHYWRGRIALEKNDIRRARGEFFASLTIKPEDNASAFQLRTLGELPILSAQEALAAMQAVKSDSTSLNEHGQRSWAIASESMYHLYSASMDVEAAQVLTELVKSVGEPILRQISSESRLLSLQVGQQRFRATCLLSLRDLGSSAFVERILTQSEDMWLRLCTKPAAKTGGSEP